MKICIDCKHFVRSSEFMGNDMCNSPVFTTVDPIYGDTIKINIYTARARCDGHHFEPKDQYQHTYGHEV